jgi:hypothetical protein
MNDTTFLLDESLQKLATIHTIQTEMEHSETWVSQPQVNSLLLKKKENFIVDL